MSKSLVKLQARVETLRKQLAAAEAALESAGTIAQVDIGSVVSFKYGRGETATVKSGVVLGAKTTDNGVSYLAVEIGEGFDKEVVRIPAASVISTVAAPVAEAPQVIAE